MKKLKFRTVSYERLWWYWNCCEVQRNSGGSKGMWQWLNVSDSICLTLMKLCILWSTETMMDIEYSIVYMNDSYGHQRHTMVRGWATQGIKSFLRLFYGTLIITIFITRVILPNISPKQSWVRDLRTTSREASTMNLVTRTRRINRI